jgi:feruloyl esterase
LPQQQGWNGRLSMLGNGGYSSALPLPQMTAQLQAGYAVVATDTGHSGDSPDFALGRPEAIVDWGHRAVHLTAVRAKSLVAAFYGKSAQHAYFQGCSTGGHQAFMEAQRFPEDFDGIIAGAPGHNRTHLNAGFLWQFAQNHTREGQQIIPASKLPMIARASSSACGKEPLDCDFDPAALMCTAGDSPDCLTEEQVHALKRMYGGARNPRTGERIYFGWPYGSESGWRAYWADPMKPTEPARASFWRVWAFNDPQWDWRHFDFDRDMQRADDALAPVINAMDANLEPFRRRGGKLIHYHGMADPVVPFADSLAYRDRVIAEQHRARRMTSVAAAERATSEFYRLFLAPGLGHCQGGIGNLQPVIEQWVEKGVPPQELPGVTPPPARKPTLEMPGAAYLR